MMVDSVDRLLHSSRMLFLFSIGGARTSRIQQFIFGSAVLIHRPLPLALRAYPFK